MGLFDSIVDAVTSVSTFIGAAVGLGLAFAFPALLPLTALGILGTGAAIGAGAGALYEFTSSLMPDITSDSPTYNSDQPVYTVEEGTPIAKPYGRCRLAGNIIRSNDPGETTLKILIGHGQGEIDSLLAWKINNVEWDHLTDVKWWVAGYAGSVHFKNTALGTDSQNVIQVDGADLFALDACAHRGIAHTGFKLTKNDQIAGLSSILVEGRFVLCEPIGGGAKVFSRCAAVIMWDFYRDTEGYEIADLDINAFSSLETLCDFYPTSGDGGPIRPPGPNDTTVKATSFHDARYCPFFSFDINKPITGTHIYNSWASTQGQTTNQRLNVDLGIPVVLTKIVLVNHHSDGGQTTEGIQNFVIQGSNTASDLDHTTYADAGSGWTNVQTGLTATQYDSADPYKNYEVASPGTAYRYYSIKIANNHGGSSWLKVRDICFYGRSPRYTFDFNFDTEININDAKKLIWSSFNGRVIRSQGKLKPVWDWSTMADGSGGLTTKTSQYSFTMDNIVKGSFTWFPTKRANKITIEYLDSSENYKKTPVTEKDDSDIDERGEVISKTTAYYITQRDVAARRCRRQLYRAMYADYQCKLTGFPSSQKLEVYELVEVTHTLPDWTTKKFIILDKAEDEYGRPTFLLEAYYAGVFDDLETPIPQSYFSQLPNPINIPSSSTNITATLVTPGSGYDYCAVKVSFTAPAEYLFYSHTEIYASRDDSTYYLTGISSGEDFVIQGMGMLYHPGDTCYIKLRNVNSAGVIEPMPSTYDASVVISTAIQIAGFYADLYNFWGGNAAINHADTKIVMGNLDGTPKIALGVSADAITFAGTQSGFFVDGDGYMRVGGTQSLKWDPSTSRLAIGEWIISPNGIADNFTEADATILLDKTNALMRLGATSGDYITIDGANQRIRSSNYVSGVFGAGFTLEPDLLEVGNIACRGIFRMAVFQTDVTSVLGGNFVARPGDVLATDMTAADASTLTIEGNETFAVGDFLRIKDGTDDEWFEVTNIASAPTYIVTRDKDGDYAANANPAWKKGASVINFGQSGDGAVYITASETNAPYLSVFTHAGEPWNTITTRVRIGNLNGFLGYASDLYGIAIGEANKYLKYDPTNGLRIKGDITVTGGDAFSKTDDTLDDITNGASYGRVALTAISAGKIVLTSVGVTGTLPTSLSAAKCTDVNADQTSTHTAANAATYTGASINTGYTAAKCTDVNADQTSTHTAANAATYTGASINTGYTAAKCTDVNADQTSTHTAANAATYTGASINTGYTAAKCTDVNADQTSTHTAANAATYTGASINTGYTAAKCTDVNADQTSVNVAASVSGQGNLATLNTVNATYIDAGSITLVKCAAETTNQMFSSAANKTNIEAWRHASDASLFDGGAVYAKSITATQIILGTNLLPNSDFSSWDSSDDAIYWDSNIIKGAGAGFPYLEAFAGFVGGAGRYYSSYYISVRPNTTYVLSAWLKAESGGVARVNAIEYDINKANATTPDNWNAGGSTTQTWTRKEKAKRTAATTHFIRVACVQDYAGKWGAFDCIQFEQAGPDGADLASIAKASEWSPAGVTQIHGGQIVADNLAVITADMGAITAGTITMPNTGWIKGGQTDFATGTGFFLGYSGGAYVFSFGSSTKYIKWDASDLLMSDGLVQRRNLPFFVAGNILEIYSDAQVGATSQTPVKVKEIYIARKGTLRIKFEMTGTTAISHARVYRNGVAVGAVKHGTGGIWNEHSQDLGGWDPGDYVQIYAWHETATFTTGIRNFRLYSTMSTSNLVIT